MANTDQTNQTNQTDKHNVTNEGDKYKATVTRYFDDMDTAVQWAESTYSKDTPEKAASEMTTDDAEDINSNVNPAPIPAGATQVPSGGSANNDGSTDGAPAPDEAADELAVNNTAAGTHDPTSPTGVQEAKTTADTPSTPTTPATDSKQTSNN